MKIDKIANRNGFKYTTERRPFKGSNTSGVIFGIDYAVFSYNWYCIFYYSGYRKQWYECFQKYNATTAKHLSQLRPDAKTIKVDSNTMVALVNGYINHFEDVLEYQKRKQKEIERFTNIKA